MDVVAATGLYLVGPALTTELNPCADGDNIRRDRSDVVTVVAPMATAATGVPDGTAQRRCSRGSCHDGTTNNAGARDVPAP